MEVKIDNEEEDSRHHCFFIAGFSDEDTDARERYDRIIHEAISPACEKFGYNLSDMTKRNDSTNITPAIWNYLADYELAIADITSFPPNVMYELGARHAMHRPTIIIRDSKSQMNPFDIHDIVTIPYKLDKLEDLKEIIVERIKSSLFNPTILIANVLPGKFARTISGEREVFRFLNEQKRTSHDKYHALWCFNQKNKNAFKTYYEGEKKAQKGQQDKFRLINTTTVNNNMIIDHVKLFKDDIINRNYRIRPTNHIEYAFNLFQRSVGDRKYYMAVLLLPGTLYDDTIELAIYSENERFYWLLMSKYEELARSKKDLELDDSDDDQQIEDKVKKWISETK